MSGTKGCYPATNALFEVPLILTGLYLVVRVLKVGVCVDDWVVGYFLLCNLFWRSFLGVC